MADPKAQKLQAIMLYPFEPQYQHTNSPNWSLYISKENKLQDNLVEDQSSFSEGINLSILTTFSLDCVLILLRKKIDVCHFWDLKG